MDGKPIHYDGSMTSSTFTDDSASANEPFQLTDEMRAKISGNPFTNETKE